MTQEKLTFQCPACGDTRFKATSPQPGPNDPLTCANCGGTVRLGEIKANLEKEARAAIAERLRGKLQGR